MVSIMGWVLVLLVFAVSLIFPLKLLYLKKRTIKSLFIYKRFRPYHRIIGLIIIILGILHGYLALGAIKLHTGSLLLLSIIITSLIAVLGPKTGYFRKKWINLHRWVFPVIWLLIIVHIFFRSIL